jgi:hypothetical protein
MLASRVELIGPPCPYGTALLAKRPDSHIFLAGWVILSALGLLREIFHAEYAAVSQSTRRICWPSKTILLASLRLHCVLCGKVFTPIDRFLRDTPPSEASELLLRSSRREDFTRSVSHSADTLIYYVAFMRIIYRLI